MGPVRSFALFLPRSGLGLRSRSTCSVTRAADYIDFDSLREYWGQPLTLQLSDGTAVSAESAFARSFTTASDGADETELGQYVLVGHNWTAGDPRRARVWTASIDGPTWNGGNLRIVRRWPHGHAGSSQHLRLNGGYVWHLIQRDKSRRAVVALVEHDGALEREVIADDFLALQFVLGQACALGFAIGLDESGQRVAAMGLHFGFRPVQEHAAGDGPIPDDFETGARWIPVAFRALAPKVSQVVPPVRIPISGYLDALNDHVDGAYLKVQVAMEAFCHDLRAKRGATYLVADPAQWDAWVAENAGAIGALAKNATLQQKLEGKVLSAKFAPSSDAVEDGLAELGIALPKTLVKEIGGRNKVVHRFLMSPGAMDRDVSAEGVRVEQMKTVLTALLMRHVGYDGPINGWERDKRGWKMNPTWWVPASPVPSQQIGYACAEHVAARPARTLKYERVLSLDGGGTWALIQAHALMDLFGANTKGHEVLQVFDLAVANSGGSIVLAGLASNLSLRAIADLFESEDARRLVFRSKLPDALGRALPLPRYPTSGKHDGLRQHFGETAMTRLAEWRNRNPQLAHLMIVGFDYDVRRATFFRTDAESRAGSRSTSLDVTLLDAVHASTNAPVLYFVSAA